MQIVVTKQLLKTLSLHALQNLRKSVLALFFIISLTTQIQFAYSSNFVTTSQAINEIERSLLFPDQYDASKNGNQTFTINSGQSQNDDEPEAEGFSLQIISVDPLINSKDVSEKEKLAYNAALVGQHEVAIEIYKQILAIKPNNNYAKFGMAISYQKLNQYKQAKNIYYNLLRKNPSNKKEIIGNLLEIIVEESPNDAIYLLAKLSAQNPKSAYILARSAMSYDKINRSDQAIMLMNRAASLEPDNMEYKFNLAIIYDHLEDYPNALSFYKTVIRGYVASEDINQSIPIMEVQKRVDFIQSQLL